jgi:hypothetical protein
MDQPTRRPDDAEDDRADGLRVGEPSGYFVHWLRLDVMGTPWLQVAEWAKAMAEHRQKRPGCSVEVHGFKGKHDETQTKEMAFVIAVNGAASLQLHSGTMEPESAITMARWILETFSEDGQRVVVAVAK